MIEEIAAQQPADEAGLARVLIVEDHTMLAEALALGLRNRGFACRVADSSGTKATLDEAARWHPALVLLDLDLGAADGLSLVRGLRATGARVLVITGCRDESRLAAAVALGAAGWVSKTEAFESFISAAERAVRNEPLIGLVRLEELTHLGRERLREEADLRTRAAQLTPREREVLAAMADGTTAQGLSERFTISIGTARAHIRSILMKLGVSTQLAAVAMARQLVATRRGIAPDAVQSALGKETAGDSFAPPANRMAALRELRRDAEPANRSSSGSERTVCGGS
jgi:two-component system, NarL family, nitrate/nitrite response regulator NarL